MKIAPLLFDMDGLLLDTERVALRAFAELAKEFGHSAEAIEKMFLSMVGTSSTVTRQLVAKYLPGVDVAAFGRAWGEEMQRQMADNVPLMPHVDEVLRACNTAGHPMAVVTSSHANHARDCLGRAKLLDYFHTVIGGDEVANNKPHPEPYLAGAAALGADPASCFAFDDSDIGVASATAAGCKVVQIPDVRDANTPFPQLGQHIAKDLRQAIELVGVGANI